MKLCFLLFVAKIFTAPVGENAFKDLSVDTDLHGQDDIFNTRFERHESSKGMPTTRELSKPFNDKHMRLSAAEAAQEKFTKPRPGIPKKIFVDGQDGVSILTETNEAKSGLKVAATEADQVVVPKNWIPKQPREMRNLRLEISRFESAAPKNVGPGGIATAGDNVGASVIKNVLKAIR